MNDPVAKNDLLLKAASSRLLTSFQPSASTGPRRTTHGGCAWSLPSRDQNLALRQPQDGSLTNASQSVASSMLNALRARRATTAANDDRLSGATRSLSTRILGLNGMKPRAVPALEAETERYFAEPSALTLGGSFSAKSLRPEPTRKAPGMSRNFPSVPTPQTKLA